MKIKKQLFNVLAFFTSYFYFTFYFTLYSTSSYFATFLHFYDYEVLVVRSGRQTGEGLGKSLF